MGQMTVTSDLRVTADDVRLRLGPPPERRIGDWLYAGLRAAIADGGLPAAALLPSSRALAAVLGLARGTVTAVADRLVDEGLLRSEQRAGLRVTPPASAPVAPVRVTSRRAPTSPGTPDPGLFPRAGWSRAFREALGELSGADLGYPDPQGLPQLRAALAEHLRLSRGVRTDPDSIVVVAGVAQGFSLISSVLGRGAVLAVEDPGSAGSIELFRRLGLALAPVPVDERGMIVGRIAKAARAAVVTPAHQYPLGVPLAPQRRRELVDWAADGDRLVVEDDYDAELRYDRSPVPALQGLAPDRVLLAGSVSKTLSPALRLGWLVAPPGLVGKLVDGKRFADLGCSVPEQATLAAFLRSGAYSRHTRRARGRYLQRRELLPQALAAAGCDRPVLGVAAGLHLVIELDSADEERRVVAALAGAGAAADAGRSGRIAAQPLSAGSFGGDRFGLVVGTARMTAAAAAAVAAAVARPATHATKD
jgi:GntR family transcriptional regulator/MocR family aminotransferase